MDQTETSQSIEALATQAGVPVRTIRFYITRGLLPSPSARGKAASYGEEHLLRLRLIRRLVDQRVPLEEIRQRLADLDLDEVRALLAEEERRMAAMEQAAESPKALVAALLERAHTARQVAPSPPLSAPQAPPEPPGLPRIQEREWRPRLPFYRLPGRAEEPLPGGVGHHAAEAWRRWELAPGVELHVRHDVEQTERGLIERVLALAGRQGR